MWTDEEMQMCKGKEFHIRSAAYSWSLRITIYLALSLNPSHPADVFDKGRLGDVFGWRTIAFSGGCGAVKDCQENGRNGFVYKLCVSVNHRASDR